MNHQPLAINNRNNQIINESFDYILQVLRIRHYLRIPIPTDAPVPLLEDTRELGGHEWSGLPTGTLYDLFFDNSAPHLCTRHLQTQISDDDATGRRGGHRWTA